MLGAAVQRQAEEPPGRGESERIREEGLRAAERDLLRMWERQARSELERAGRGATAEQIKRGEFLLKLFQTYPRPEETAAGHTAHEAANVGQAVGSAPDALLGIFNLKPDDRRDEIALATDSNSAMRAAVEEAAEKLSPESYQVFVLAQVGAHYPIFLAVSTDRAQLEEMAAKVSRPGMSLKVFEQPEYTSYLNARVSRPSILRELWKLLTPSWPDFAGTYEMRGLVFLEEGTSVSPEYQHAIKAFLDSKRELVLEGDEQGPPTITSRGPGGSYSGHVRQFKKQPFELGALLMQSEPSGTVPGTVLVSGSTFKEGEPTLIEDAIFAPGKGAPDDAGARVYHVEFHWSLRPGGFVSRLGKRK
jgi:hypothetical protein